jgi:NPCBM/NEW2 domain/Fn3 associated
MLTRRRFLQAGPPLAASNAGGAAAAGTIEFTLQSRDTGGTPHTASERVDPRKVAIFAIDCWHYHWCRTWRNRAGSLMPRFNHSFDAARKLGMTLLFSPTNAVRDLHDSRQRRNTLALPDASLPALADLPDPYPRNLRFGMCECGLGDDCHYTNNVNNQHPDLKMREDEYIALTQQEAYNVMKHRGITHIIYTGFATNMCMWGKPTGMKYMRQFGFRCIAARDLTEAITRYAEESFNPTRGTLEVIELIERELAPTISMEATLRAAGVWEESAPLDYVHIAPWGRFFGGPAYPIPIQAELTCRHVPGAELRYTLDGSEPDASSFLYRKPIEINQTTRLQAAGFRAGQRLTRVSVAEYWKFPPAPPPPDIHISDLNPVSVWTGEPKPHSYAVKKAARMNRSVDGNVLSNRDYKFGKGIGIQAPSRLVFPLQPGYRRFVALVGVDDECMRWDSPGGLRQWPQWSRKIEGPTSYRISQLIFSVSIDGKAVARTPALFNGDKTWGIEVKIPEGAREIELSVADVESNITDSHGHGDWLNAGFLTA